MSDSGVKQSTEEIAEVAGEVTKDVKDAVGEMIEQGVQSVVGNTLTPQQIQKQQLDDQKKIEEARHKINYWKKIEEEQSRVRAEAKQKEMMRLQNQKQEDQVKKIQLEEKKNKPINPALSFAGKPEKRGGVGG